MELGISTGLFSETSILKILPLIKEAGFGTIEIWAGSEKYGGSVHFNWHKELEVKSLERCLKGLGLKVDSLHAPFSEVVDISSPDEKLRNFSVGEVERSMEVLKQLGGRVLVVHPASTEESLKSDIAERFSKCRQSLEYLYIKAQDLGVQIALETQLPHIFGGDSSTLWQLVEGFSLSVCGFCFDVSHTAFWRKGAVATYDELSGGIKSLHISDNNGVTDDHLIPGEGQINWREIVRLIKRSGACEVFMLEVMGKHKNDEPRWVLSKAFTDTTRLLNGR